MTGETVVFRLPDGSELLVKHWPDTGLDPAAEWHAAVRDESWHSWGPPLQVIRVEKGT